jgi:hypothetical protein
MATYTAADQINRALRLLGVLAEGETPSASVSQDALMALNQMIDSWSVERLSVFNTIDQMFTWPTDEITRTIGPTGNFVGLRPVLIDDSTYYRDPATNVSFGIKFINQQQYNGIAVKTVTSTYPQVCWVNMEYPDARLTIYPKPTRALEWHIVSAQELTQPATLATVLAFPPGYLRAFTYNLAMEFAPEFGVEPSPQVTRIAMTSKRDLKRINDPGDVMSMPYALVSNRNRFNIYAGNM